MPILFASTNPPNLDILAAPNPFIEGSPCNVTIFLGGKLLNLVNSNIDFNINDITSSGSLNLVPSAGGVSLLPSAGNPITFGTDLQVLTNVISSLNANENIVLTPNGTGSVLTGNLGFQTNTINSTNTDGNIILSPNGMGLIILGNQAMNPPTLDSMANLFNLNSIRAGNLELQGNTLSSTDLNGNIIISPNGTGQVIISNIVFTNNNIYNVNSISTINLDSINISTNVLTVNSSITTPQITAGNLRIIDNSIVAINTNGNIDLRADGHGNVIYYANLDGNNNNFFNINDISTNTLHATDITITSQTISSPIYRGWIVYNGQTDGIYKTLNAVIDRKGPGNYIVNWDIPPPNPFYGINVSTSLDVNGNANFANITNQTQDSFEITISTQQDTVVYCTMFY